MAQGSSSSARVLTDHDEIRNWAEERGAEPACVIGTGGDGDIGMIRLDFPGYSGEGSLEPIDWDDWFQKFDERNLALLVQDETARGERSNFNKLVSRETVEKEQAGRSTRNRAGSRSASRRSRPTTRSRKSSASRGSRTARAGAVRGSRASSSSQRSGRTSSGRTGRTSSSSRSEARGKKTNSTASRSTRRKAA